MNFIIIVVFFSTLFISPIMVISSSNILVIWLRLELRTFSFLPFIFSRSQTSFSSAKYFLIQRVASVIILFSFFFNHTIVSIRLMFLRLILKLGMAPFHFWVPNLARSLQIKEFLIFLIWQKIGPLFMISFIPVLQPLIKTTLGLLRVAVGRLLGLKQTQWKQIFVFSSVNHLGWLVISRIASFWLFVVYFIVYAISFVQTIIFNFSKIFNSSIFSFTNLRLVNLLIILSLAGLPPMLGFFTKILVILYLMSYQMLIPLFLIILFSVLSIFFYLKIFFSLSLTHTRLEVNRGKLILLRNIIIFFAFPLIINFYKL